MGHVLSYGRYAVGIFVTVVLVALWLSDVLPLGLYMAPIAGLVGGFLLRSWWSVLAIPLVALATASVMYIAVADPEPAGESEITLSAAIILSVGMLLLVAVCAAIGAGAAKRLSPDETKGGGDTLRWQR